MDHHQYEMTRPGYGEQNAAHYRPSVVSADMYAQAPIMLDETGEYDSEDDDPTTIEQDVRLVQGYGSTDSMIPKKSYDKHWSSLCALLMVVLSCLIFNYSFKGSLGSLIRPRNYQGLICGWDGPVKQVRQPPRNDF